MASWHADLVAGEYKAFATQQCAAAATAAATATIAAASTAATATATTTTTPPHAPPLLYDRAARLSPSRCRALLESDFFAKPPCVVPKSY